MSLSLRNSVAAQFSRPILINQPGGGNRDIWLKDLVSGKETNLTTTPLSESRPTITADGSRLAYRVIDRPASIHTMAVRQGSAAVPQAGVTQKISIPGHCGYPWSWSSDGTKLLYNCPGMEAVRLFDAESGETTQVLGPLIFQVSFSPDDRWLVFGKHYPNGRERVFIVPFDFPIPPLEKDWIPVTDGAAGAAFPRWSPDGNLLYFVSDRDGFRCVWAQRLDPATKRPEGSPFPTYHSHGSRRSLLNVGLNWLEISLARDKIAFPMGEVTGKIWLTTLEGRK